MNCLHKMDDTEVNLAPRQWAIMLADEMRRHPSELAFLQALSELEYWDWPTNKPYFVLIEQAKKSHPGVRQEARRERQQRSAKLRKEFCALSQLICIANRDVPATCVLVGCRSKTSIAGSAMPHSARQSPKSPARPVGSKSARLPAAARAPSSRKNCAN